MSTSNKTTTTVASLKERTLALKDTSKMIRYLYKEVTEQPNTSKVAQVEKLLKSYGVKTRNGHPIRYQHVRNVALMPINNY